VHISFLGISANSGRRGEGPDKNRVNRRDTPSSLSTLPLGPIFWQPNAERDQPASLALRAASPNTSPLAKGASSQGEKARREPLVVSPPTPPSNLNLIYPPLKCRCNSFYPSHHEQIRNCPSQASPLTCPRVVVCPRLRNHQFYSLPASLSVSAILLLLIPTPPTRSLPIPVSHLPFPGTIPPSCISALPRAKPLLLSQSVPR